MIRIAQPLLGDEERQAVLAVLDSGRLASGPVTQRLEETFAREVSGTRVAVAVANGTAALHLALLAHDIGPGDEVITTPFTFQATANRVLAVGARPVFVDIGEDGNIDPLLIEAAITARTRAVLPVHLYGRVCDMDAIVDIARRHGLVVIEDAAQAHGARLAGRAAGSFGTGCFSLYATKNVTSGEGGVITTNDAALAERLRRLRSHGESERYLSTELGFNYRLTDVAAAIGLAQLGRLNEFTAARRRNAAYLSANLRGVVLPPAPTGDEAHVWHQYTVRIPQGRDDLAAWLRERDIETAVHYPRVLPAHPLYANLGYDTVALPIASKLANQVLSLPVHPGLSQTDLEQIVATLNAWTESHSREPLAAHE
jgi:dTDP-4-amino-4,6-dideoxygalactose transaminase